MKTITAYLGCAAVAGFAIAFLVFAWLTPDFQMASDFLSKLGARGQPFGVFWNAIGFAGVGCLLAAFGLLLGITINDRVVGFCLLMSGLGFAMAAAPTDFADTDTSLSRSHYASICMSLAGWFFALARIGYAGLHDGRITQSTTIAALLATATMIGMAAEISAEPIAHRLMVVVVFGWVVFTSAYLAATSTRPPEKTR